MTVRGVITSRVLSWLKRKRLWRIRLSDASKTPSSVPIWASAASSSRLTALSFSPRESSFAMACESQMSPVQLSTLMIGPSSRATPGARPRQ